MGPAPGAGAFGADFAAAAPPPPPQLSLPGLAPALPSCKLHLLPVLCRRNLSQRVAGFSKKLTSEGDALADEVRAGRVSPTAGGVAAPNWRAAPLRW